MLKQSLLLAVAAGTIGAALPTAAQEVPRSGQQQPALGTPPESITVRPTTQVRRFYMPRDAVQEVSGQYLMEDGNIATVTDRRRTLSVDFDNRRTELEAVGAYVFQSAADDMTLVFTKDGLGDDMIVLSYIPQRQVAGQARKRVLLSSR